MSTAPSGTLFFVNLFRRRIPENIEPSDSYRDPNLVNATNNINVLILVLHICLHGSLHLTHTAYFIWSLWTSHRTLPASLSPAPFFSGTPTGEGETADRATDLLSVWDEQISSSKMTLSSDMFRNSIRRT